MSDADSQESERCCDKDIRSNWIITHLVADLGFRSSGLKTRDVRGERERGGGERGKTRGLRDGYKEKKGR